MSKELAKTEKHEMVVSDELLSKYLKALGCPLSETQTTQFVQIAKAFGLNPFLREIYGVPYIQNKGQRDEKTIFSIIIGYETFLKRAERTGRLHGWKAWTEGSGDDMKACIEINRKDWPRPFYHECYLEEYDQKNKMWKEKPRTMLKKVVTGQGFRLCFPEELGGLPYLEEEIDTTRDINDPVGGKPAVGMPTAKQAEPVMDVVPEPEPDPVVDDMPEPEPDPEPMPEPDPNDKPISSGKAKYLFAKCKEKGLDPNEICARFLVKKFDEMTETQGEAAKDLILNGEVT